MAKDKNEPLKLPQWMVDAWGSCKRKHLWDSNAVQKGQARGFNGSNPIFRQKKQDVKFLQNVNVTYEVYNFFWLEVKNSFNKINADQVF